MVIRRSLGTPGGAGTREAFARRSLEHFLRLMSRGVPTPDYSELAVEAVGHRFALLSHACSLTELLTFNCMNLIGLGKGVVSVFPMLSTEGAMCICVSVCVGLSAVPDRHFSYIALISALAILTAEGTCFLGGLEMTQWEPCSSMLTLMRFGFDCMAVTCVTNSHSFE
eukprot:Skav202898  [mRNA]  locus=scaffold131:58666:63898:- [translate_table: standard]